MAESSYRMKRSEIWNFFTPTKEKNFAKCNLCKARLSHQSTISNLSKHLKTKHVGVAFPMANRQSTSNRGEMSTASSQVDSPPQPSMLRPVLQPPSSPQQTPSSSHISPSTSALPLPVHQTTISSYIPQKLSLKGNKLITDKLMKLFSVDFQPFSIVEDEGFKEFVSALNPSYQIPSRHVISKTYVPAQYEQCKNSCKEVVQNVKAVCITTDTWTSVNTQSFLSVTAHFINSNFEFNSMLLECSEMLQSHTAPHLAEEIQRITTDWDVTDKVVLAVSDNANNITSVFTKELKWNHYGCFAHKVNLIVNDALENTMISEVISKVRKIVSHFKRSSKSSNKLMDYQKKSGMEPKKLIKDVCTRWNSTYFMLERFVKLEQAIRSTMAVIDTELPAISQNEWKICRELCEVLLPFFKVTNTMSGQNYATGSLVVPIVVGLKDVLKKLSAKPYSDVVQVLLSTLKNGVRTKFENIEKCFILAVSTFLDPRFKAAAFSDQKAAESIKQKVIVATRKKYAQQRAEKQNVVTEEDDDELSIWSSLKKTVAATQSSGTASSQATIELERYLVEDMLSIESNPLTWWRNCAHNYPNLSSLVIEQCCALATSVPCERLFSKAGQLYNDRRNRLNTNKAEMLLFLKSNFHFMK